MKHMFQDKVDACFSSYDPYTFFENCRELNVPPNNEKNT